MSTDEDDFNDDWKKEEDRKFVKKLSEGAVKKFFSRRSHLFLEEAIALSIETHGIEETKEILKFHLNNLDEIF